MSSEFNLGQMDISIFGRSLQPQLQAHFGVSRFSPKMTHFLTLLMCSFLTVHAQNLVKGQDQGPIEVPDLATVSNQNSEQQNDADSSEQFESSWKYLKTFGLTDLFKVGYFEGSRIYVRGVGLLVLLTFTLWLASDHLGIWRTLRGASKTRGVRQLLEGFEAKQVTRIFKKQQISKPAIP